MCTKKKGKHTKNKQKYRKDKKTNIHVNTREKRLITRFISMSKLETLTFFFFSFAPFITSMQRIKRAIFYRIETLISFSNDKYIDTHDPQ